MTPKQVLYAMRAMRDSDLGRTELSVMNALLLRIDVRGECFPGVDCIAADIRESRASVKRALAVLRDRSDLPVRVYVIAGKSLGRGRGRSPNRYQLTFTAAHSEPIQPSYTGSNDAVTRAHPEPLSDQIEVAHKNAAVIPLRKWAQEVEQAWHGIVAAYRAAGAPEPSRDAAILDALRDRMSDCGLDEVLAAATHGARCREALQKVLASPSAIAVRAAMKGVS